jgi:hypothetical protein
MEPATSHDTGAPSDEDRTSPKGRAFEAAPLRELARSILGQPALADSTRELTQEALSQAAVPRMSDAGGERATEAVRALGGSMRDSATDALAALTDDDWTALAREHMEDAQMVAEEAAAG